MRSGAVDLDAMMRAVARGDASDAEIERWLRDVCDRGMTADETFALTMAMARSGETLAWSESLRPVVDKHSTGGVGDAVTLIAVPVAAACGARVAKLSGRALGHTGGTIDKLECIPGFRTELGPKDLEAVVARVGCAIAAAGPNLAPADKRIYAIRHRTGLVASIPLIASSVMSKKLAAGADAIVLDVKFGDGAFMRRANDARELADTMRTIGARAGRKVTALLTNMDEPLANSVGDALELDEALTLLEGGRASAALRDVAISVASAMLECIGVEDAGKAAAQALQDGRALTKFREMVVAQGGGLDAFARKWPTGQVVRTRAAGRIQRIDALAIGQAVADAKRALAPQGASRVGIRLLRRSGASVREGDGLFVSWLGSAGVSETLANAFEIAPESAATP